MIMPLIIMIGRMKAIEILALETMMISIDARGFPFKPTYSLLPISESAIHICYS